jgi:DNA (cytosine-5)-methyltransferase 1
VATGNEGSLAAIHLSTMRNSGKPYSGADEPTQTMTAGGANAAVVAAFLAQHSGGSHPGEPAKPLDHPVPTITGKGCQTNLVAAHLLNLRGQERRDAAVDAPLRTESAGGNHAAVVAAFLAKYYGAGEPVQAADDPLHTLTAKPRHGLVMVTIEGESFVISDIGMRMLTPRERFNAQGFRPDYEIERGLLEDRTEIRFTLEQQGRMCGNSVCPGMARALVAANYRPAQIDIRVPDMPLLEAAE